MTSMQNKLSTVCTLLKWPAVPAPFKIVSELGYFWLLKKDLNLISNLVPETYFEENLVLIIHKNSKIVTVKHFWEIDISFLSNVIHIEGILWKIWVLLYFK